MRFFYVLFFTFFFPVGAMAGSASSQDGSVVDSLKTELDKAEYDSTKANILIDMANEYVQTDTRKALDLSLQAYIIAKNISDIKTQARSETAMGLCLIYDDKADSSLYYLKSARVKYMRIGNSERASDVYINLGIAMEYLLQYDSAIFYYRAAVRLSDSVDYALGYSDANLALGTLENATGKNKEALQHTLQAYKYYNNPDRRLESWSVMNNLGIIYDEMGLYSEALDHYLNAMEIVEEIDDNKGQIVLSNNIGIIYNIMENNEKALVYYNKAMELSGIIGDKENESILLNNIAFIHLESGDTLRAIKALKNSVKISKENNLKCNIPYGMEGLGDIYVSLGRTDSAKYYLEEALKLSDECQNVGLTASAYRDLGKLYTLLSEFKKGAELFSKSLKLTTDAGIVNETIETTEQLYKLYKKQGNTALALKYYEEYSLLRDSIFSTQNSDKITRLTAEFEFKKEKQRLEFEQSEIELGHKEEIGRQQSNRNSILTALILTILLAITLGRSYYLIQSRNAKLQELNEEKNTLMGVVAHDLRSPLNNIKALMNLLKEGAAHTHDMEQIQYLGLIDDTTDRMREMIDRVLDLGAIEEMKVNLNTERVDLGKSLLRVSKNFKHVASQKTIHIQNNVAENENYANVDANYLTQIFDNLISNAIKFSDKGTNVYLSIDVINGHQTICVKDEGPGISIDDQAIMFKKFQKLSAKPTDNEESTGLGLSIVKKFVEAMQGEIWCESELQKGSTFFIKFKSA